MKNILLIFTGGTICSCPMGENGKNKVLKQFDWKLMADILEQEFIELYNIKNEVSK